MNLLKLFWKYLVVFLLLSSIGFVILFWQKENHGIWIRVLSWFLMLVALFILNIGGAMVAIKQYPKFKSYTIEHYTFRSIRLFTIPLGYIFGMLFSGQIQHEMELAQGFLTASSILTALCGVLLTIARFPKGKNSPQEINNSLIRSSLVFSLFAGFVCILFVLFWFAQSKSWLLEWAAMAFLIQFGNIFVFLFFPKYYLKT